MSGVDEIIELHQERPDGSGYPNNITDAKIDFLPAVFIVSHDLVSMILKEKERFSVRKFFEVIGPEYKHNQFKKIY